MNYIILRASWQGMLFLYLFLCCDIATGRRMIVWH
nr:MAG TPA: hypothetical protein [Caudoviricetes sp.]